MEIRRRARRPLRRARHQHPADPGHEPRRRHHPRARRRRETLGRHRRPPPQGQGRRAPTWPGRERNLRRSRQGPPALGRQARVHGRGRPWRLHLRPALRPASGNKRERHRAALLRPMPQRSAAGGGEPGYSGGREAGRSTLGGQHPPRAKILVSTWLHAGDQSSWASLSLSSSSRSRSAERGPYLNLNLNGLVFEPLVSVPLTVTVAEPGSVAKANGCVAHANPLNEFTITSALFVVSWFPARSTAP